MVFFFKQKTAYEMRISDLSSDVCSSDLDTGIDDEVPGGDRRSGVIGDDITTTNPFQRRAPVFVSPIERRAYLLPRDAWNARTCCNVRTALDEPITKSRIQEGIGQFPAPDRKSTRLNSSH